MKIQVKEIEKDEEFILIQDTHEIAHILYNIGLLDLDPEQEDTDLSNLPYHCLFVKVACGDYEEIYALEGSIPWLESYCEKIYP